jgi:hypothetical protein
MLFSPTIGAAIAAGYWFLRVRCPACRTTGDIDLRTLDWHRAAAVTALTPTLSCRSCRPNAPFAELVCLSKSSAAEEYCAERSGRARRKNKENAMISAEARTSAKPAMATRDDLLRLAGDVDERKVLDILALRPTVAEIEQAALWAAGDGDVLAKGGHPLIGTAAEVLDILTADEEEEPPPIR